jgi:hypothetical protein
MSSTWLSNDTATEASGATAVPLQGITERLPGRV